MPSVSKLQQADPFQESVYNLVPKPVQVVVKPPRHKSVYAGQAKNEYQKVNQRVGVIGPAHVPRDDPQKYLKKHTAEQKVQVSPPSNFEFSSRRSDFKY